MCLNFAGGASEIDDGEVELINPFRRLMPPEKKIIKQEMKRFLFMLLAIGLIAPAGAYAQKVYKDGTRIILDLTVEAGMPVGSVTSVSKTDVYENVTGSSSQLSHADNKSSGQLNKQVFQKLEIAPRDLSSSTAITGTAKALPWLTVFKGCKNLNHNGTGWRLPTQQELLMIYVFREAIKGLGGGSFNGSHADDQSYWSATEAGPSNGTYVNFYDGIDGRVSHDGYTYAAPKTHYHWARCVREVTP